MTDITKKITVIDNEEQLQSVIDQSDEKLVGPCDAIYPTLNKVLLDYENCDQRIQFASCSVAKVGAEGIRKTFPSDSQISLEGCIPIFALYRLKTCVSVIVGVDAPSVINTIEINMPVVKKIEH